MLDKRWSCKFLDLNPYLKAYIEERYQIVFSSQQSYYDIFEQAGLSWKKSQKRNPKTAPELVKKKPKN